jgi:hypothetical protein
MRKAAETRLYHLALVIDTMLLLLAGGSALVMTFVTIDDGLADETAMGLTAIGRTALWAIPLVLVGLMSAAYSLKARGALVAANVLLWLPALPFALSASFWVVLMIAFAIGGR